MHPRPGHASERIAPNQRRWPVHSCAKGDSKCIGFPAWKCQSIYSKDSKVLAPKNSGSIAKKAFCGVLSNSGSMQIITRHLLSEFLHHHHPLRQATHTTSPEGKSVHGHLPIHVAAIPSAKHPPGWVHFEAPENLHRAPFSSISRGPGLTQNICDLHWICQFCTGGTGGL